MCARAIGIEPLAIKHWPAVRDIYVAGIGTGAATFEQEAPDWEKWDADPLRFCRLIARVAGEIAGWAALSPVSSRPVYAGVAEVSIYVAEGLRDQGVGAKLLAALIEASESAGIWTLHAGIFPENTASIKLHQRAGFRAVGVRQRLGCLRGRWRDVVLMEGRSNAVQLATYAVNDRLGSARKSKPANSHRCSFGIAAAATIAALSVDRAGVGKYTG